ncbi:MAG: diguanylate cyclase [Bacillota bacterium]|nr:diguanylate cyclase [Bacillota bacterium]
MNRTEFFEKLFIKSTWLFIAAGFLLNTISLLIYHTNTNGNGMTMVFVFYPAAALLNLVKSKCLLKYIIKSDLSHILTRVFEITIILVGIVLGNIGEWAYIFALFAIITIELSRGIKFGYMILSYWMITNMLIYFMHLYVNTHQTVKSFVDKGNFTTMVFYCLMGLILVIFCNILAKESKMKDEENKALLSQLEEKYQQLAAVEEEVQGRNRLLTETNKALEEANLRMEESNKRLTSSIAEFYTLQEIGRVIGSIFDTTELLRHVNDIILGVMGVSYSTILLYDDKKGRFKVNTTNIKNKKELVILNDNINCEALMDCLQNGNPILENFADSDTYSFIKNREVKALIAVPLTTKTRKFGVVLVEHKYFNAFDDGNLRLLAVIGQQVGIAMENAALYQQMQEMATVDGLTGVYNRLYFQDRLSKEFIRAQENDYKLSLAIFDIDHFKKFNDTYGHLFGDKVLKSIASLVKGSIRGTDIIARFGGEEFVILFSRTSIREAYDKVEILRKKIASISIKDNLVAASVTVSFGVSSYPETSLSENEMISHADDALYDAKSSGRNCVRIADTIDDKE